MREKLLAHMGRGHKIVIAEYGDGMTDGDVTVECETCNVVLVSAEDFDETA